MVDSPRLATIGLIGASLSMGVVPVFARTMTDDGMAPVAVSFYRNLLGAVLLIGFINFDDARRNATLWGLLAGVGMGFGWTAYVEAVTVVPVSTAGVVYMSYPLFALLVVWLVFGNRPIARSLIGGVMVLGAAAVALGPELSGEHSTELLVLVAAPLSFGFAIAVLTERLGPLRPLERVATVGLGSSMGLLPLVASLPASEVIPSDGRALLLVVAIGLVTGIGPQWIYVKCAPRVGPAKAAVSGAVELPTMFFVGAVAFGEAVTTQQFVAGLIVVGAILLVPSRPSPATALARRRRRLIPGRFSSS